ncbi:MULTISPECIES: type 1 glutamine amidotransferase domain-containing protein [Pseudomonas]|jgi:putative intracellular protease/amidase|uniref:Type 1 glutamine amidotransferase domain-containing protein n=1 Tax=Pseudomonas sp. WC2401 TaxID=3234143 RepID=A0AB39WTN8_9PSED|nr:MULTISPECIES: type 1 glutamine amidotransferase domain-containing protein [Pseudomonas]AOA06098.1 peptidase C56 [Pseudomonas sp. TMW 2.1634]MBM1203683.1 type 1 glutamine amidotransferase domain-containing protein [Pseudomonas fragi]NNB05697.1 type 1 glutamine amidotransferase domain-containing protein [Pseudomonas fragi]PAA28420.1 type 1 glutamine amidotransferase domain-containing protein [Pseudomonas fragi]PRW99038.1 type 1 glutamine amidotransferase domain-containing protein [Pseudomonas
MSKKILVVLTSVEKYPDLDRPTGLWLGEAVHFVHKVQAAGFKVDYVSPQGGYTPIDPHSLAADMASPIDWQWYHDKAFMNRLGATLKPDQVNPDDYIAIYYAGGHGVIWDFPDNTQLQALSRRIYEQGGVVSSVCHGAVGLLNIKLSDGELLIKGKKVTGFSNEEEELAGLTKHVPYLTETELVKRGAIYQKADAPWAPFAIADGRLITGQNPASGGPVAELVLKAIG